MYEVGMEVLAWCGQCKVDRRCRVASLDSDGDIERVTCTYCNSSRNYRAIRVQASPAGKIVSAPEDELRCLIRSVLREEYDLATAPMAERWRGGTLILRPGKEGSQEKAIPIDVFFHKIVMIRDRLRVLEQQINSRQNLPDEEKIHLQEYITRCYGSLTTFNILFKEKEDQFVGSRGE
jgi:hypothetical protein